MNSYSSTTLYLVRVISKHGIRTHAVGPFNCRILTRLSLSHLQGKGNSWVSLNHISLGLH